MSTRSKRSKTNKYKHYTPAKLVTSARKWQKKLATFSKTAGKKKINGKSITTHKTAVQKELKRIAAYLSSATTKQINAKIKMLKTQMAKYYGVKPTSRKAISPAVKRLKLKYKQFKKNSTNVFALIKLRAGLKLSSFKNPIRKKAKTKTKTAIRKTAKTKTAAKRRTIIVRKLVGKKRIASKHAAIKTKSLKKEISKLKKRNMDMKKLVLKFRKEVAQLQRHYGALHKKPSLHLVHGKKVGQDVSNIVRFSNALSNAFHKQHRKAG